MSVSELSASAQNHLKVIWGLQEWSDDPVLPSTIAEKSGLRPSSVSGAISKLVERGLVEHEPYGAVHLTDAGRRLALDMVRRHRLIETFLVRALGYGWDEVHDEAEELEHAVSDLMVERLDAFLGHPRRDPHGDPIPAVDGSVQQPRAERLSTVAPGRYVVERISDDDPDLLRFFADNGIELDVELVVGEGPAYSGAITVGVGGGAPLPLGRAAAEAVRVSSLD
ncbi:metal-dependent transcriptional regulator [Tessaracoccus rhinocerotis]|uniref:Manganese transport regulator n=1 Tax=Tessaracoccus rhinocerotis TaxID=1689449 RepID=A0A553K295_9ACTN|nr:metal-dependent transcriptional regulator [Tessaracoccus rhinocerotis]TRY18819.1 metal-dependent transcriptional regulator [Tessaracoccus rhinocerotis]